MCEFTDEKRLQVHYTCTFASIQRSLIVEQFLRSLPTQDYLLNAHCGKQMEEVLTLGSKHNIIKINHSDFVRRGKIHNALNILSNCFCIAIKTQEREGGKEKEKRRESARICRVVVHIWSIKEMLTSKTLLLC